MKWGVAYWFVRLTSPVLGPLYVRLFHSRWREWLLRVGIKEEEMFDWIKNLNGKLSGYRTYLALLSGPAAAIFAFLTGTMGYEEMSAAVNGKLGEIVTASVLLALGMMRAGQKNDVARAVSKLSRGVMLVALGLFFALPSMACATLLHPERRGQECLAYDLDLAPAVLDGSLLLLGVVPGAVALGVDAQTGALWECKGGLRTVAAPW